jgi:excisionase family DNA binding protein
MREQSESDKLLLPRDVRRQFGVGSSTLRAWADQGKIGARRTLGGHRRYRESEVRALVAATEAAAI